MCRQSLRNAINRSIGIIPIYHETKKKPKKKMKRIKIYLKSSTKYDSGSPKLRYKLNNQIKTITKYISVNIT